MFLEIRLAPISRQEWAIGLHDPRLDRLSHLALELRARGYGAWFNVCAPPFHSAVAYIPAPDRGGMAERFWATR
jgi:hypothetical protein